MPVTIRQLQHLAAAMAHEVRNPLNSMAIHLELLEGRLRNNTPTDREAAMRSTKVMAGEIERVDRILEEYLDFAGPEEAARETIDAERFIADVVERGHLRASARGVRVEAKAGKSLGRWSIDADALAEAIDAALDNAIQASPRGTTVEVAAATEDEQAVVRVIDRGDGISAEDLPRVFHIGFSRRGRDGIGLTVAKQIVKAHGGSIVAESKGANAGATLTIRVPLDAPDPADPNFDQDYDEDA